MTPAFLNIELRVFNHATKPKWFFSGSSKIFEGWWGFFPKQQARILAGQDCPTGILTGQIRCTHSSLLSDLAYLKLRDPLNSYGK